MTDAADGGVELVPSTDRSIVHRQKIETETESAPVSLSLSAPRSRVGFWRKLHDESKLNMQVAN